MGLHGVVARSASGGFRKALGVPGSGGQGSVVAPGDAVGVPEGKRAMLWVGDTGLFTICCCPGALTLSMSPARGSCAASLANPYLL